uniref:Ubiquitin-conjugating enzyme E2 J2 n=1 Tax=Parastrongyloides trichosuri TaxID=131310 RepID=A0A0N4ZHP1_PARTI
MISTPTPQCIARLRKDYKNLIKDPIPLLEAVPLEENICEWHFCIVGAPDTPYLGGYYHGKLVFPPDFPFRPPAIYMITPSGRFKTNSRLCLSMSDFHPDTWNPCWNAGTIISGLMSFMNGTTVTHGSLETTEEEKKKLAKQSLAFNLKDKQFVKLFPATAKKIANEFKTHVLSDKEYCKPLRHDFNSNSRDSSRIDNEEAVMFLLYCAGGALALSIFISVVKYYLWV